jgi:hypothetical protein
MTGKVVNLKSLRNSILVWDIHGEPTVESYELSEVLGYAQYGSLRKQILTDWKEIMQAGDDYILVHDSVPIRQYEAFWDQSHRSGATNKPARTPVLPKRGYLFITGAGLQKILERTTKENAKAFSDETALIFHELDSEYEFVAPDDLSVDISTVQPSPPKPAPAPSVPEISQEDRRFQYDVLQTLLKQLQEFDDVAMKEIAIAAAEAATGKDFSDLRRLYAVKTTIPATQPPKPTSGTIEVPTSLPKTSSTGPVFTEEGFYSLKAIGDKAGGYSPSTAGKAANVVAKRMGYSPQDIRQKQLSFNQLPILRDTNGRPRQMFRFGKEFSNAVITELRTNERLRPTPVNEHVPSFSSGAHKHVNLTAPLALDGEVIEESGDPIDVIVQTLQGKPH